MRDCTALVLDGVWPYELARPRPETAQLARYLDRDLRAIVERTNEQLALLGRLNLAPIEQRAAEERFIRVAKSMAVLRVESTVRQIGGRSILGTPGMPTLAAAPGVADRRSEHDNEVTTVVSTGEIAEAVARARGGWVGQEQVLARHRRDEESAAVEAVTPAHGSEVGRPPRGFAGDERFDPRAFEQGPPPRSAPLTDQVGPERLRPNGSGDRPRPAPPSGINGHRLPAGPPARPRPALALEPPVSLEQMVGSLARQQPGVKWLVAERDDGSAVAVCDVLSGWIPVGVALPVGVTVLAAEKRSGPMEDWVGPVTRSARYGPGNRIESRSRVAVAGDEAFGVGDVGDVGDDLGGQIGEATNRPGLPRIAHTLARAAGDGGGVSAAELDVLNVHVETAVQMLLGEYPDVNADEVVSCMLMGAAAAFAARRVKLAAYHFGWFEAVAGRR